MEEDFEDNIEVSDEWDAPQIEDDLDD